MRTRLVLLATALLAGGGLASPAVAAPPFERFPANPEPFTFPFEVCGTTVTITELVQREKINLKNMRVTGALKLRITNEVTGQSTVVNASGPGTFISTVNPDGTETVTGASQGRSLFTPFTEADLAKSAAMGLPEIFVTSGPVTTTAVFPPFPEFSEENPPPEDFVFEPISESIDFPNRIQDVCALIT